jgi:hypothetical protein
MVSIRSLRSLEQCWVRAGILGAVMAGLLSSVDGAVVGPTISEPIEPNVMDRDLRTLPLAEPWKPGEPTREVPLRGALPPPAIVDTRGPEDVEDLEALRLDLETLSVTPNEFSTPNPTFEGITQAQGGGFRPPDTQGDVGLNHYIQVVNVAFQIWDKQGTCLLRDPAGNCAPRPLNSLWAGFGGPCQNENDGDPIVNYDHLADRWLITRFTLSTGPGNPSSNNQCIAISRGPNPVTDGWYLYQFQLPAPNDYPKIGVWPDAYYMGSQQGFSRPSATTTGLDLYAFDRASMLNGNPARFVRFFVSTRATRNRSLFLMPSDLDGPEPFPGTPNTFIRHVDGALHGGADRLELFDFSVNWQPIPPTARVVMRTLRTLPFSADCAGGTNLVQPCVTQRNTSQRLESLAVWIMWRAQYRNFGTHETLVTNHTIDVDGNDHAGIRWYELRRTGGGTWTIFQQGTYSPDARNPGLADDPHRFMGSIAMDRAGNMALGFSASSSTLFPSIRYVGRLASDPPGLMPHGAPPDGDFTLSPITGVGSQTASNRWGDYSSMNIDPEDDCTFWYTNQYVDTSGNWRTRIGAFFFPQCMEFFVSR